VTMMAIDDTILAAYVDGELTASEIAGVEKLLAQSEVARRKVREMREVNAQLKTSCSEHRFLPVPGYILALAAPQMTASHDTGPGQAVWKSRRRRHTLSASFLLLMIAAGSTYYHHAAWRESQETEAQSDEMLEELAEYHVVYARETEHLVEVPASRKAHIEEWLGNRLNRKLVVPDLSENGLEFAGARMLVMEGRPVAQLIYTRDGVPPAALCIASSDLVASAFTLSKLHGLNVGHWNGVGYIYIVIGDMPELDIWRIAAVAEHQL
jgi:anti-sigma factor RsiW